MYITFPALEQNLAKVDNGLIKNPQVSPVVNGKMGVTNVSGQR